MRHAVLNKHNIVINVIKYKPGSNWNSQKDQYLIASDSANIGDWYDKESNKFFMPRTIKKS